MNDFTANLIIHSTGSKIYDSLTNFLHKWWTEMFEGSAHEIGDIFTIRFGSEIHKTMKVEELILNQSVTWLVVDACIDLPELDNKKEWIDTRIIWTISTSASETTLKLTHIGLTPEVQCYDLCKNGWQSFLYSLKKYLNTGIGVPFKLADAD
jgi:hypothetical protein